MQAKWELAALRANGRALTGVRKYIGANGYELSFCYLALPQRFQLGLLVVVSLASWGRYHATVSRVYLILDSGFKSRLMLE